MLTKVVSFGLAAEFTEETAALLQGQERMDWYGDIES